jgi:hypothetical protein
MHTNKCNRTLGQQTKITQGNVTKFSKVRVSHLKKKKNCNEEWNECSQQAFYYGTKRLKD